jgi:diadenosine tetraphosphate (Ap4A) HIT family hydrolase
MGEKIFPNEKIIVTKNFDIHQDWEVPIPGFFVIVSKRNRASYDEFDLEEMGELSNLIKKLRKGMREVLDIQTVCFFQDEGTHHNLFHIWIFPRYEWMNEFGSKIESIRPIINYAKNNMVNHEVFEEVKDMVRKMKDYMNKR